MLTERTQRLAGGPHHAVLTTLFPDGQPQSHIVWVDHDGENLLVNSETLRQKVQNVRHDPRVSVVLFNAEDFDDWVEIRGRVVEIVEGDEARSHIDKLSAKYIGLSDYPNPIRSPRVILKIAPVNENVY